MKRRLASGNDVVKGPSRIESMPNMRNAVEAARRSIKRREHARTKCAGVTEKPRAKSAKLRHSGREDGGDHATPTTTSGSSSVIVDIEATPPVRTSLPPPPPPRPESPISENSADATCLQSPVNSSGVRIVIDNDNDVSNRHWSLSDADSRHFPDEPETLATADSVTSVSGDDDSSNVVVLFHCGPNDDVDDDAIANLLPVVGQP